MLENFRSQKIIWDRANKTIFEKIEANSGDSNGRKLVVQVINQGVTENLSGTTLSLGWKYRKSAKGLDAFDVVDASKGIFEIYYTTEMLSNIGNIGASLILTDSTGRIESSTFTISVTPSTVDDESVQSENSFTALTEALVKLNKYQSEIDGIKQDLVDESNQLITTEKAELDALQLDYAERAETLEETYAPKLTEVTAQLAHTPNPKNTFVTLSDKEVSDNQGYYYWWVSEDNTIYASKNALSLVKSTDNGNTWVLVNDFARRIVAVREMSNGELLVGIDYNNNIAGGEVYVSSNNQTTFEKVLTNSMNARLYNAWNVNIQGNLVILGEYGNQGKAHKIWISQDFGNTFSEIFDLSAYATIPTNAHLHGVLWDKFWNRIWITYGDGTIDTGNNQGGYYSDDMGQTWTKMHIANQLLNMYALDDSVLFFTDAAPNGVYRYVRKSKNEQPTLDLVYRTDNEEVSITHLCTSTFRKNDKEPLLMGFKPEFSRTLPPFILATYNGVDYFKLWSDDVAQSPNTDIGVVQINDTLLGSTTGDSRFASGSKILGNIIKKDNLMSATIKSDYKPFVDVRDLGLKGHGVDETREMINALNYVSDTESTLYIPKKMTILVKDLIVSDLKNFNIVCQGKIKLIQLPIGGGGTTLELINSSNVNIYEINIEGNGNKTSFLQHGIKLTDCLNIHIGTLNSTNPPGNVLEISEGKEITVNVITARGNDSGQDVLRISSGENIFIDKIYSNGVGAVGVYSVSGIHISPKSATSVLKNIQIGKVVHRSGSKAGLWIKNNVGAVVENIGIESIKITKTLAYTDYLNINEASYIMNVVGVKDLVLKGVVKEEKTSGYTGTALFVDDVFGFDIDLKVNNANIAYIVGEKGIENGKFKGVADQIGFDIMRIAKSTNAEFNISFGEYSKGTSNRYAITSFGTIKALTNVSFKRCKFTKPTNSSNNILLLDVVNTNVIIAYSDLSEWEGQLEAKKLSTTNAVTKMYNIGLS